MQNKLGKLKKVNLREIWSHEEHDFTKWLAQEENLNILADEVGTTIKLIQTEASVGKFSVDILAEEESTGRKIIIENQLEETDHDHLGKIITYASGYNAGILIWIVKGVRDEHKQAIDWLNEHTDEGVNCFAIKMELWQIGDSQIAPKFHIVSQPNDWAKAIKAVGSGELSESSLKKLEFLKTFIDYCKEKDSKLRLSKPQPKTPGYYYINLGISGVSLALKINQRNQILKLDVYFLDKDFYNEIKEKHKEDIEKDLSEELIWDDLPGYKGATVGLKIEFNIEKEENWQDYFAWAKEKAEKFDSVFVKYIKI